MHPSKREIERRQCVMLSFCLRVCLFQRLLQAMCACRRTAIPEAKGRRHSQHAASPICPTICVCSKTKWQPYGQATALQTAAGKSQSIFFPGWSPRKVTSQAHPGTRKGKSLTGRCKMRSPGWLGACFDSQPVDDLIPDGVAERQPLTMLICQSPRALAAGCIACRVLMVSLKSLSSSSSIVKYEAMRQVRQRSYHYFCDSDMHQLTLNEDHNNDPNLFQQA